MKKTGIVVLVLGLLITVFSGFNFVTKEKVVDVGKLQVTREKDHGIAWSPIVGLVVMLVGGGLCLSKTKEQ